MTELRLADLVGPESPDAFLRTHWDQDIVHYPKAIADRTCEVLDLTSFELLLGTLNRAHEGWLHLVRDGSRPVPPAMVDEEGMLRLGMLWAAFRDGHTLYLTKAHRACPPLMRLCRSLDLDLGRHQIRLRAPVSAHVFLTPPAAQGFPPHRDEHGSLILQLAGSKDWDVYDQRGTPDRPLRPGFAAPDTLHGEPNRITLAAGDVLYLPAWRVHSARTSAEHSLHVTLRVFPLRWADLLGGLLHDLDVLEAPVPADAGSLDAVGEGLAAVLRSDDLRTSLPALLQAFFDRAAVSGNTLPGNTLAGILAAPTISASTPLVKAPGVSCSVTLKDTTVVLAFGGGSVSAPVSLAAVFHDVAAAHRLRPMDLPSAQGAYDRVELARRLIVAGVLVTDPGAAP